VCSPIPWVSTALASVVCLIKCRGPYKKSLLMLRKK
jgi:hypothetical protein